MPIHYFGGFNRQPSTVEVNRYMRGECAYIALALNNILGDKSVLVSIGDTHFAVKDLRDGTYRDIRGMMTEDEVLNGFSSYHQEKVEIKEITRDDVIRQMDTGLFSDGFYVPHRERLAVKLMRSFLFTQRKSNKIKANIG